jgi:hypothetical protein
VQEIKNYMAVAELPWDVYQYPDDHVLVQVCGSFGSNAHTAHMVTTLNLVAHGLLHNLDVMQQSFYKTPCTRYKSYLDCTYLHTCRAASAQMGVNGQRTRWRVSECIAESDYQSEVAGFAEGEDFLDARLQVTIMVHAPCVCMHRCKAKRVKLLFFLSKENGGESPMAVLRRCMSAWDGADAFSCAGTLSAHVLTGLRRCLLIRQL